MALGAKHVVNNGNRTLLWLDRWIGNQPLKDRFPGLYNICLSQMSSVAQVCGGDNQLRFRRIFGSGWIEGLAANLEHYREYQLVTRA
jgi:hypothetical protein